MAHITTDINYITILCPKCGREVRIDISTDLTNGVKSWYSYHCQHCGRIGNATIEPVEPEHRAYSLDETLTKHKKIKATIPTEDTQIIDLSCLKRIADSLDEIKELLKEVFDNG